MIWIVESICDNLEVEPHELILIGVAALVIGLIFLTVVILYWSWLINFIRG